MAAEERAVERLRRMYPEPATGARCFGVPIDGWERDDLLRVIRLVEKQLADAREAEQAVSARWQRATGMTIGTAERLGAIGKGDDA